MTLLYLLLLFLASAVGAGVFAVIIIKIWDSFTTDVPFVSVPADIENDIIAALKLKPDSVLFDLGCGDGRILRRAVESAPPITAVGVEKGWWSYILARFATRGKPNISIRREDIFKTDLREATHIFLYLYPHIVNHLTPILQKNCAPGTRIVSCDFECTGLSPEKIIPYKAKILIAARGFWYTFYDKPRLGRNFPAILVL